MAPSGAIFISFQSVSACMAFHMLGESPNQIELSRFHWGGQCDHQDNTLGVPARLGIVTAPVFQVLRLANIQDFSVCTEHAVHARLAGKTREIVFNDCNAMLGRRLRRGDWHLSKMRCLERWSRDETVLHTLESDRTLTNVVRGSFRFGRCSNAKC